MTQNDDRHSDNPAAASCARGHVELLHAMRGHYELRVQQTMGPMLDVEAGTATVCMTEGELRGLQKMIEAMFPSAPERVSLDLSARRSRDGAKEEPPIEVG